ncbi:MAG: penicillin-binding protein 2, partial [Vallitaleaceae bacterium]|nr:penicillin-binding protein 2 [Vallitaleaceae bacterium]
QSMFGFGYQTNIDLSGEVSARNVMFKEEDLNVTELATSSFGQGQKITPIQLITAFSSLINGGYLFEPHLMKMVYSDQNIIEKKESILIRQVISNEVSRITTQALAGVVNEGTGAKASIAGYEIGGKTGTAEKLPRGNNKYIVSFIGFAPVDNPQVITLVIVDEPEGIDVNSRFAAKIFVDVMEDVMPYLHIFKSVEETEDNQ